MACFSALLAAVFSNLRRASLSLWVCGLSVGGVYLALGMEYLAIVQWVLATLVGMTFVLYSFLFGGLRIRGTRVLLLLISLVLGSALLGFVWTGIKGVLLSESIQYYSTGLAEIGAGIIKDHLISLEITVLTLFLSVVGAGVIARPRQKGKVES